MQLKLYKSKQGDLSKINDILTAKQLNKGKSMLYML